MSNHYLTWWNLENVYDSQGSTHRPAWAEMEWRKELQGWTAEVLQKKLDNLTSIIHRINNAKGPDLLGVCELENQHVADLLLAQLQTPHRNYKIAMTEGEGVYGVDLAIIYDANRYTLVDKVVSWKVQERAFSPSLLHAHFMTENGATLDVILNHWPGRSSGIEASEPYRIMAADTLRFRMEEVQKLRGKNAPVIVMGDFNDEPTDRSLSEYALSVRHRNKVNFGQHPYLLNMMLPLLGKREGSFVFNAEPLIPDQILLSRGFTNQQTVFSVEDDSINLEKFADLTEGRYDQPTRFGRPSNKKIFNPKGFSDHLPISITFSEN